VCEGFWFVLTPCPAPTHQSKPCRHAALPLALLPAELLSQLTAREQELGIEADPDLDAFMKALVRGWGGVVVESIIGGPKGPPVAVNYWRRTALASL